MQDRLEDMATAIIFSLDQLCHSAHFLVLMISHNREVISQHTRELRKDPVFDVAILQYISDEGCDEHGKLHVSPVQLHVVPEVSFVGNVSGVLQIRRCRIPFEFLQVIQIRLLCQEIGI